jgi:long-chain acyl-CoA synthetase
LDRIWLKNYASGVPHDIDPDEFPSIPAVFAHSVAHYGDRPAFGNLGTFLSYEEMGELVRHAAAFLQSELKLTKGDRIAVMLPNILQQPIMTFAALQAGLIVVNVNPLYTPRELEHQLKDSGATAIVVLDTFAVTLEQIIHETAIEHVIITRLGDMLRFAKGVLVNLYARYARGMSSRHNMAAAIPFQKVITVGSSLAFEPVDVQPSDLAFLQYTGGTTGVAKGAMLTHRNIIANTQQTIAWISPALTDRSETIITALPLYHIFALTANCMTFVRLGGLNYLITDPRDMKRFVSELGKVKFTGMTGVNTLFNGLLHTQGFSELDFSAFRLAMGGGMAVQRSVAEQWQEVTGTPLAEAYGLTEASPAVCMNPVDLSGYNAKIGLPLPSTHCSIRGDDGVELDVDEPGELWIKGPQVMLGYWNCPAETTNVLGADGWLRTGDITKIDREGFLQLVDRKKDMILVSGFNVFPNEIEDVLAAHPGVLEVAAIGIPDPRSGESVKLFVVKKEPALTTEQLDQYCKKNLTGYKRPSEIEFRESLPKTTVGKILRHALRPTNQGD